MIEVILLLVAQLMVAAVPMIREKAPAKIVTDDVEGIFYGIPEYEDPQLVEYELSAMGGSPILSLLQVEKKHTNDKARKISEKEDLAENILELGDIITSLQSLPTSTQKGSASKYYDEFVKSVQGLKKLEHQKLERFHPNIFQLLTSMRQSMSLSKPILKIGIIEVVPTMKSPTSDETPVDDTLDPSCTDAAAPNSENKPTTAPDSDGDASAKIPKTQFEYQVYKSDKKLLRHIQN